MTIDRVKAAAACQRVAAMVQRSLEMERNGQTGGNDVLRVPLVQYALAALRQRVMPALVSGLSDEPPHIVMFGGTNSGKSTVLNVLLGRSAAKTSCYARFTQHPIAFCPDGLAATFLPSHSPRFEDYRRYDDTFPPRQSDQELRNGYRPALAVFGSANGQMLAQPASDRAVFWDVPDYSTEEAQYYMRAVLDTAAMADLVVMLVTNENYAGHRDKQLRGLILESGVPVRAVANKLHEGSRLIQDIQLKLADGDDARCRLPADRIHALPWTKGFEQDEHDGLQELLSTSQASDLRRTIAQDVEAGVALKKQALENTVTFLDKRLDEVLAPLKAEADVASQWQDAVNEITEREFNLRYKNEYLMGRDYADFNLAFLKLLDLLEMPGIGKVVATVSRNLRKVTRLVYQKVRSIFGGDDQQTKLPPEHQVLDAGFQCWIDDLNAFARREAEQTGHRRWRELAEKMDSAGFRDTLVGQLQAAWTEHRQNMEKLTQRRAAALFNYVNDRPMLRKTLQGTKFTADAAVIVAVVATGGLDPSDLLVAPAVLLAMQSLVEIVGEQFVENQKRVLKEEQYAEMQNVIGRHMARPVRELFQASVSPDDLRQVREDFQLVRQAAMSMATT